MIAYICLLYHFDLNIDIFKHTLQVARYSLLISRSFLNNIAFTRKNKHNYQIFYDFEMINNIAVHKKAVSKPFWNITTFKTLHFETSNITVFDVHIYIRY